MITCLSCGTENPSGQRFCGECGARLGAPGPDAAEERKVVTALFCDLVGFTATSEAADPEDVDRMLSTYAAMATGHIERHGGVVEKFIGDAVVGIFGVPAAHEDDPERPVRAALRIAEDAEDLEAVGGAALRLRCALGQTDEARTLLAAIESTPGLGDSDATPAELPAIVRAAIAIGEIQVAERIAGHLTPRYPYAEHSLIAVSAALAGAHGDIASAAVIYADAAARWEAFGVVTEEGFALLGQGRCFVELARPGDAADILVRAREIFSTCGMKPAVEETDGLLARATALSS